MATVTASNTIFQVVRAGLVRRGSAGAISSPVLGGLPELAKKGRVVCSMEVKAPASNNCSGMGMSASLVAAATAAAMSSPASALVDERMSTEGTGLPFGLSNNILGWILLGVFALIWSLYTVYTSTLEESEESGLSL
ncbi:photosystem II reaction center W protein, chloroplastic-like [Telopea speciosissima]|uniref:photosystem II reaction center W protein, chloroplastic-like n=1 Tax=Telopea speciosissima TaxID=54955 RepID=UPI001CC374A7|nr:photosystem II reaction center W protein, chloroplastic-like [Telopea speciosissima]